MPWIFAKSCAERRTDMSKWIGVKDRLLDDNERVIAFRPNEADVSAYKYCVMWGWSVKISIKHRAFPTGCRFPNRRR